MSSYFLVRQRTRLSSGRSKRKDGLPVILFSALRLCEGHRFQRDYADQQIHERHDPKLHDCPLVLLRLEMTSALTS